MKRLYMHNYINSSLTELRVSSRLGVWDCLGGGGGGDERGTLTFNFVCTGQCRFHLKCNKGTYNGCYCYYRNN